MQPCRRVDDTENKLWQAAKAVRQGCINTFAGAVAGVIESCHVTVLYDPNCA